MCDSCWNAAYITARLTGKHQSEVYKNLVGESHCPNREDDDE
jgi:hypothetical protein